MKEIYRNIASEVGISVEYLTNTKQLELLEKFAELVRADEREACAKVCDALAAQDKLSNYYGVAARAIRERVIDVAKVGEVGVWGDK